MLIFSTSTLAADFDPFAGPRPIAVVIKSDPWLMVIGSDTPKFVLYEDGRVVYLDTASKDAVKYRTKLLTPTEFLALKAGLSEAAGTATVPKKVDISGGWTDQPWNYFYLDLPDLRLVSSVYGDLNGPPIEQSSEESIADFEALPEPLRRLNEFVSNVSFEASEEWIPPYVEVMAWDYSYAPDASIKWPHDWPGLNSRSSIKRGESFSIFLPGSEQQRLSQFLRSRSAKGAVEIDGRKMAVSYRPAFPSEKTWTRAFRE